MDSSSIQISSNNSTKLRRPMLSKLYAFWHEAGISRLSRTHDSEAAHQYISPRSACGTETYEEQEFYQILILDTIYTWWDCLDISSTTENFIITNRNFCSISDERLQWLRYDFLTNIQNWHREAPASNRFPKETFEALLLTKPPTLECIEYLLSNGFLFVLTKRFTSDPIERFQRTRPQTLVHVAGRSLIYYWAIARDQHLYVKS